MTPPRNPYPIGVVVDAFRTLELLAAHGTLGPTELASRLGCPKNRAFRILRTLVEVGQAEELGAPPYSSYRLVVKRSSLSARAARAALGVELVEASRRLNRALSLMRDDAHEPGRRHAPGVALEDVESLGEATA